MLVEALRDLEELLCNARSQWAQKVAVAIREVENGDAHGARRFLEMHGGMGSLNDSLLDAAGDEEARRLNLRLRELDERAWSLASALVREVESGGDSSSDRR